MAELRAHPWRAALSGVSLCIGVLAIIAIFTISSITAEVFIAVAEQRDGRAMTVVGQVDLPDATPKKVQDALDAAAGLVSAGGAAALVAQPTTHTGVAIATNRTIGEPLEGQTLTLVAGDLNRVRRLPLLAGVWLNTRTEFPVELVANQAAAMRWGGVGTILAVLATSDQPPIEAGIVGIIADGDDQANLYVSLPAMLNARPTVVSDTTLQAYVHHPGADLTSLTQVAKHMATACGGRLESGTVRRSDQAEHLLDQLASQRIAFLVVAVIALVISALGILNIGLASVSERARELVIRRAIGATRSAIAYQGLIAAALIGLMAASLAIPLAVVGVEWWVPQRISAATAIEAPTLPWAAAVWGILAGLVTSLVGSLIPAIVAARLDVANALRD